MIEDDYDRCYTCGAMVKECDWKEHSNWHYALEQKLEELEKRLDKLETKD